MWIPHLDCDGRCISRKGILCFGGCKLHSYAFAKNPYPLLLSQPQTPDFINQPLFSVVMDSLNIRDYTALLDRAYAHMPESVNEKSRFEIPKAMGHIEGKKTVISNFLKIVETLGRDSHHLVKFMLKELATPGELRRGSLILGTKVSASTFNTKIREYADEFVLCHECGKPDTKLVMESGLHFLRCTACGAKSHVKSRV